MFYKAIYLLLYSKYIFIFQTVSYTSFFSFQDLL